MAIGNLGAVKNLLEGYIASEFIGTGLATNQGLAILPEMVERIASRADLTEANLRVTRPTFWGGTNDVDVEAGAVRLIAAVVAGVTTTLDVDGALVIYETNTVTEGTTKAVEAIEVRAGETTVVVWPSAPTLAALSYSVVDNDAALDTDLAAANSAKVMLVYAE